MPRNGKFSVLYKVQELSKLTVPRSGLCQLGRLACRWDLCSLWNILNSTTLYSRWVDANGGRRSTFVHRTLTSIAGCPVPLSSNTAISLNHLPRSFPFNHFPSPFFPNQYPLAYAHWHFPFKTSYETNSHHPHPRQCTRT